MSIPGASNDSLSFSRTAATIILGIAYGVTVSPENDPYVALAQAALRPLAIALMPGAFLVVCAITHRVSS